MFDATDADAWFHRNAPQLTLARAADDPLLLLLHRHRLPQPTDAVCDLGASNGWRVASLTAHAKTAVELSGAAIAHGTAAYPDVTFLQSPLTDVDRPSGSQHVVLLSFVLHWIARASLLDVAREVDRLLAPGGHLALSDFWPASPLRVPFKHRAGLWTWKQDYSRLWLATEGYELVETVEFPDAGSGERCAVWLLRKHSGAP